MSCQILCFYNFNNILRSYANFKEVSLIRYLISVQSVGIITITDTIIKLEKTRSVSLEKKTSRKVSHYAKAFPQIN